MSESNNSNQPINNSEINKIVKDADKVASQAKSVLKDDPKTKINSPDPKTDPIDALRELGFDEEALTDINNQYDYFRNFEMPNQIADLFKLPRMSEVKAKPAKVPVLYNKQHIPLTELKLNIVAHFFAYPTGHTSMDLVNQNNADPNSYWINTSFPFVTNSSSEWTHYHRFKVKRMKYAIIDDITQTIETQFPIIGAQQIRRAVSDTIFQYANLIFAAKLSASHRTPSVKPIFMWTTHGGVANQRITIYKLSTIADNNRTNPRTPWDGTSSPYPSDTLALDLSNMSDDDLAHLSGFNCLNIIDLSSTIERRNINGVDNRVTTVAVHQFDPVCAQVIAKTFSAQDFAWAMFLGHHYIPTDINAGRAQDVHHDMPIEIPDYDLYEGIYTWLVMPRNDIPADLVTVRDNFNHTYTTAAGGQNTVTYSLPTRTFDYIWSARVLKTSLMQEVCKRNAIISPHPDWTDNDYFRPSLVLPRISINEANLAALLLDAAGQYVTAFLPYFIPYEMHRYYHNFEFTNTTPVFKESTGETIYLPSDGKFGRPRSYMIPNHNQALTYVHEYATNNVVIPVNNQMDVKPALLWSHTNQGDSMAALTLSGDYFLVAPGEASGFRSSAPRRPNLS